MSAWRSCGGCWPASVTHHGEFFHLDEAVVLPAPDPPVPIVVGGRSEAAVRRAARLGDGWLGIWVSAARFAKVVATIDEVAEQARALLAAARQGFYQLPFERFERYSPYGTPEDVAAFLAPYAQAGCGSFNLIPCAADADAAIDGVARVQALLRAMRHVSPHADPPLRRDR
jgi:alkanesulfonate monooxygenase SsuD/methylene tetrahydromethanopterin reductase-like flavin-dependent oxidoreductase (luciferase family)